MTNEELIKQLRGCKDIEFCNECPRMPNGIIEPCGIKDDAADLIEAQAKRIAELEADKKTLINVVKDKSDFHATKDAMRIAELEAQLPKEGEWIDDNGAKVPLDRDGYTTGMCRCSVCNDWLIASDEYEVRGRYCPNCGARCRQ